VSKRRETLSAKANTGKFTGLHAETPARRNSAKTAKHSGKDFVYGVLFATLLAFGAKTPVNCTAKWFYCCTLDCEYFFDLTGTEGKDRSKTSIYHKFGCHLYLLQHDSTLKKTFHSNVFFRKWNDTEKLKKNLRKESWQRTSGTTNWDKLGQVGVVGQVGQGERGLEILVGQVEQGEEGLVPNGTTRP